MCTFIKLNEVYVLFSLECVSKLLIFVTKQFPIAAVKHTLLTVFQLRLMCQNEKCWQQERETSDKLLALVCLLKAALASPQER